jgi:hypothetical protein
MVTPMTCPHCNNHFHMLLGTRSQEDLPDAFPILCNEVSMLIDRKEVRKATAEELAMLKKDPNWNAVVAPARDVIARIKKAQNAQNN